MSQVQDPISLANEPEKPFARAVEACSLRGAGEALTREGVPWSWAGFRAYSPEAEKILGKAKIYFFNDQNPHFDKAKIHFFDDQNLQVGEYLGKEKVVNIFASPVPWGERATRSQRPWFVNSPAFKHAGANPTEIHPDLFQAADP